MLRLLLFVNVVVTLLLVVALALLFILPEPGERPRKNLRRSEDVDTEGTEHPEKLDEV